MKKYYSGKTTSCHRVLRNHYYYSELNKHRRQKLPTDCSQNNTCVRLLLGSLDVSDIVQRLHRKAVVTDAVCQLRICHRIQIRCCD